MEIKEDNILNNEYKDAVEDFETYKLEARLNYIRNRDKHIIYIIKSFLEI